MATAEQVVALRRMADEPGATTYTDDALSALVDSAGSPESAAATVWAEKAARFAKLVNTSESGSSRSMSDMHKNALSMAAFYQKSSGVDPAAASTAPFTVDIERA